MAKPLLDDELWAMSEPLLPQPKTRRKRFPGRKPIPNRQAWTGILFVLKTGIPWEYLPQELGCGSGMTCWRRLREGKRRVFGNGFMNIYWRNSVKLIKLIGHALSSIALRCAPCVGEKTGPNPTDRAKAGSKHHIIADAQGIPLVTRLTSANTNDVTQLIPLVETIPPVGGKPGRPRRRPKRVQGGRGYDSEAHRQTLRKCGITPVIAKRNTPHGSGLGVHRWVVERTVAWLPQYRRLRIRYERRPEIHEAFLSLGCILICSWFV